MSGTTADLNNNPTNVDTSNDGVVIIQNLETIPGGKTLDVTGFTPSSIHAGHLIIEETSSGVLKPMPVSGDASDTLTAGHTYKGVLVASILTSKPFASVMVRGTINKNASKYTITTVLGAARTALPLIRFTQD